MKNRFLVILFSFAFLFCNAGSNSFSEGKPRVSIRPFTFSDGAQYGKLAQIVGETLTILLKLVNAHTVIEVPAQEWGTFSSDSEVCSKHSIDSILSGEVTNRDGGIVLKINVYNRIKSGVVLRKERMASNSFEVFALTDKITKEILSDITNVHISFGSLSFHNLGEKRSYHVRIDDQDIGEDIAFLPNIPTGSRKVSIIDRETEIPFLEKHISISEGSDSHFSFALPIFNPEESAYIAQRESTILTEWFNPLNWNSVKKSISELKTFSPLFEGIEKSFDRHSFFNRVITSYNIQIDGNLDDWEKIPVTLFDPGVEASGGKNRMDLSGTPGTDINYVKVAKSYDQKTLYFLINTSNGEINPSVLYCFSLFKDNFRFFQVYLLGSNWQGRSSQSRFWSRDGTTVEVPADVNFKIQGSSIEGSINIEKAGLLKEIKKNAYSMQVKTENPSPWGTYNITMPVPVKFSSDNIPKTRRFGYPNEESAKLQLSTDTFLLRTISADNFNSISPIRFPGLRKMDPHKRRDEAVPIIRDPIGDAAGGKPGSDISDVFLGQDGGDLFIDVKVNNGNLTIEPHTIVELLIWGDGVYIELRKHGSQPQPTIDVREPKNNYESASINFIEAGMFSSENGYLSMRFPIRYFNDYLNDRVEYEAEFRIWNEEGKFYDKTERFRICFQ